MSQATQERFWTASLSAAQLQSWLQPPRTEAPFTILERLRDIDFPPPEEAIDVLAWEQGCVFGPAYELRWELHGEACRAWLVGALPDGAPAEAFTEQPLLSDAQAGADQPRFMWGPQSVNLGRAMVYRVLGQGKDRPLVECREYRRPDGSLALYRLVRMCWEGEA